jgi:SM-20-related protein
MYMADRNLQALVDNLEHQNYAVMPDFFTMDEVSAWRADANKIYQRGLFRPSRIGKDNSLAQNERVRGDEIFWLDGDESNLERKSYLYFLEQLRVVINQHFMLGIFSAECHYTHYQAGSFYKKHLDQHQHTSARQVSVITYLNPEWQEGDGGELRLYLPDGTSRLVAPRAGTIVCFFSALIPHEVLPVSRERISLTAWLRTRSDDVVSLAKV